MNKKLLRIWTYWSAANSVLTLAAFSPTTSDMHVFWSIWCFSIIQCSWNGRSTKLVELVSNKYLSSISYLKCKYVGSKYMHLWPLTSLQWLSHFCHSDSSTFWDWVACYSDSAILLQKLNCLLDFISHFWDFIRMLQWLNHFEILSALFVILSAIFMISSCAIVTQLFLI
jgi:hypothetical protein